MFRKFGQKTSLNSDSGYSGPSAEPHAGSFSQKATSSASRPVQLRVDVPLLIIVVVLMIFGLLMVYSASPDSSLKVWDDPFYILRRQFLFMLLGACVAAAAAFFDYHLLNRLAVPAMIVTIIALIAVLVVGKVSQGAVRTLFGASVQPSELAKLVTIVYLAVWLFAKRDQIQNVSFGLIPLAVMLGTLGGLVFIQPDISAVITIVFLGGLMFFLAGGDLRQIILLAVVSVVAAAIVIWVSATGNARIDSYIAGLNNPLQASDHVRRAVDAFIKGGWVGVGIGNGEAKLIGLPVPHTDSIFAVVGEETGFLGTSALLILYSLLLWRGMKIARQAPDELGALLATGLIVWITFEAFINMAVMVNLLPFAGNALPFISYGGSNLLVTLTAIGILLNISRQAVESHEESGRIFSEVVDLRGRDRRRRVSGTNRTAGIGREH